MTVISDPTFKGSHEDLTAFRQLLESPPRSAEREQALQVWQEYKLRRQASAVRRAREGAQGKAGRWTKGEYVRSLTTRAIDLRGGCFEDVVLGYADLRAVNFDGACFRGRTRPWIGLKGVNLQAASLREAVLPQARLMGASLRSADLTEANLAGADLTGADLAAVVARGTNLEGANLEGANLAGADLTGAKLSGANLQRANLVGADLSGANLSRARVHGVSVWDVKLTDSSKHDELVVTAEGPAVTTDNIEVAQFVYTLLNNPRIREALDTVCRKGVLILGRFTPERKVVLDSVRSELRRRGYVPMLFDFERPTERDFTETIRILAGMSLFIIADITNPSSSPLELQAVVPDYAVPLIPILAANERPFAMFADLRNKHSWVLEPLEYDGVEQLLGAFERGIVRRALAKHAELLEAKGSALRTVHAASFLEAEP